jgi:hypothetical protein
MVGYDVSTMMNVLNEESDIDVYYYVDYDDEYCYYHPDQHLTLTSQFQCHPTISFILEREAVVARDEYYPRSTPRAVRDCICCFVVGAISYHDPHRGIPHLSSFCLLRCGALTNSSSSPSLTSSSSLSVSTRLTHSRCTF